MARRAYSYKLRQEIGLLTDEEWEPFKQMFGSRLADIYAYRRQRPRLSAEEARLRETHGQEMLDCYESLTGDRLDHPDQLIAVRMADYGAPCPACGRPFRTPRAKLCMECGHQLPEGQVAGPLV